MKTLTIVATFFVVFGLFSQSASAQCSVTKHYMQNNPCYAGRTHRTEIRYVNDPTTKQKIAVLDNRVSNVEQNANILNGKIENVNANVTQLATNVSASQEETKRNFNAVNARNDGQDSAIQNLNNTLWWHNWFWIVLLILLAAVLAFAFGRRNQPVQNQQVNQTRNDDCTIPNNSRNANSGVNQTQNFYGYGQQQSLNQQPVQNEFQFGGRVGITQEPWELQYPAPRVITPNQNNQTVN